MCLNMTSAAEYDLKLAKLEAENSQLKSENIQLAAKLKELSAQIQWFQKQLFGKKSERRIMEPAKEQLFLGEQFQEKTG